MDNLVYQMFSEIAREKWVLQKSEAKITISRNHTFVEQKSIKCILK